MAGTLGTHDVGGLANELPIDIASGAKKYKQWELQTHCLVTLLSKQGLLSVDEVHIVPLFNRICPLIAAMLMLKLVSDLQLRRGVEGLPAAAVETMSYYEKWAASVAAISMERGTIQQKDIDCFLGVSTEEPPVRYPVCVCLRW